MTSFNTLIPVNSIHHFQSVTGKVHVEMRLFKILHKKIVGDSYIYNYNFKQTKTLGAYNSIKNSSANFQKFSRSKLMVQSFSNCLLGIFQWLLGLNHKYRNKQNTDKSKSWLFIDHNRSCTNHNSSENITKQGVQWFCTCHKSLYISHPTYAKQTSTLQGHCFYKTLSSRI